jgi:hypothetical protein
VDVRLIDRIARGRALKEISVRPRRFRGLPIKELRELPVAGHAPARVELYLLPEADPGEARVALASLGTIVCEDIGRLDGMGLDHPPWTGGGIEGLEDLDVAPASRRGFVPTDSALALADALRGLEPVINERIHEEELRKQQDRPEDIAKELRRIFRTLPARLPQYRLFEVEGRGQPAPKEDEEPGEGAGLPESGGEEGEGMDEEIVPAPDDSWEQEELVPPGPLDRVRLSPRTSRLLPETRRRFRARAEDAGGRAIREGVALEWSIREGGGRLEGEGPAVIYTAPEIPGKATIAVGASQGERRCEAEAEIRVLGAGAREGVPTPEPISDPNGSWRSRVQETRWQYNTSHPDYLAVRADRRRRIRYLAHLFAKEVVLRNYGRPEHAAVLERMVEVLTYIAERR